MGNTAMSLNRYWLVVHAPKPRWGSSVLERKHVQGPLALALCKMFAHQMPILRDTMINVSECVNCDDCLQRIKDMMQDERYTFKFYFEAPSMRRRLMNMSI